VGSQDFIEFYFIKCYYNSKDSHQVDVGPKEEELESSWGWLCQQTSLTFIYGKNLCNQLPHLALVHGVTNPLVGKARDKVFNAFMDIIICVFTLCLWISLYVPCVGLTRVGIESTKLQRIAPNSWWSTSTLSIHIFNVYMKSSSTKPKVSSSLFGGISHLGGALL
jgi:hypothetical protein